MQQAHDWLQDPQALHGGVGEKSVRQVGQFSIESDINHLTKLIITINCKINMSFFEFSIDSGASLESSGSFIANRRRTHQKGTNHRLAQN